MGPFRNPGAVAGQQQVPLRVADLEAELGLVAPGRVLEVPHVLDGVVVQPMAQDHADGVFARLEMFFEIQDVVAHPAVVDAHDRRQLAVADLAAVDLEFVVAQAADRDADAGRRGALELREEKRGGAAIPRPDPF